MREVCTLGEGVSRNEQQVVSFKLKQMPTQQLVFPELVASTPYIT